MRILIKNISISKLLVLALFSVATSTAQATVVPYLCNSIEEAVGYPLYTVVVLDLEGTHAKVRVSRESNNRNLEIIDEGYYYLLSNQSMSLTIFKEGTVMNDVKTVVGVLTWLDRETPKSFSITCEENATIGR